MANYFSSIHSKGFGVRVHRGAFWVIGRDLDSTQDVPRCDRVEKAITRFDVNDVRRGRGEDGLLRYFRVSAYPKRIKGRTFYAKIGEIQEVKADCEPVTGDKISQVLRWAMRIKR